MNNKLMIIAALTALSNAAHATTYNSEALNGSGVKASMKIDFAKSQAEILSASGIKVSGYDININPADYICKTSEDETGQFAGCADKTNRNGVSFRFAKGVNSSIIEFIVSYPGADKKQRNLPLFCNTQYQTSPTTVE